MRTNKNQTHLFTYSFKYAPEQDFWKVYYAIANSSSRFEKKSPLRLLSFCSISCRRCGRILGASSKESGNNYRLNCEIPIGEARMQNFYRFKCRFQNISHRGFLLLLCPVCCTVAQSVRLLCWETYHVQWTVEINIFALIEF